MPTPSTSPVPATAKHHPNMKGTVARTRLAGGPFVDTTTTLAFFTAWSARGVSQGELIDRLTAFALNMGFDPVVQVFTGVTDLAAYPRDTASVPPKASPVPPKRTRG